MRATSRPTRDRHSAAGAPTTSGAPCTTAARATDVCSTRRFPYPNYTRVTRGDTTRCLRTCEPGTGRQPNRPHALRFPYDPQAALAVWRALFFRAGALRGRPAQPPQWNRGAYLVEALGHCIACHSRAQRVRRHVGPARPRRRPDPDAELVCALARRQPRGRRRPTGRTRDRGAAEERRFAARHRCMGPMAEVVLAQHAVPERRRPRAPWPRTCSAAGSADRPPPRQRAARRRDGARRQLYATHCARCHGEQGEGAPGAYPALAGNRAVTMAPPTNLVHIVLRGGFPPATAGNPRPFGMPPFASARATTTSPPC